MVKMKIKSRRFFALSCIFGVLLLMTSDTQAQDDSGFSVTLQILNDPTNGAYFVLSGDDIEVSFEVTDPDGLSSKNDQIQLVRVSDEITVYQKKRGHSLSDSVLLKTKKGKTLCELKVEYVHKGAVIETAPTGDNSIIAVSDPSLVDLFDRVASLENSDPVPSKEGPQGRAGAIGTDGAVGPPGPEGPQGACWTKRSSGR